MLIYLNFSDNDVSKFMDKFGEQVFVAKLAELLIAHRYGRHLIVIPKILQKRLLNLSNLSGEQKGDIIQITEDYIQASQLIEKANIHINITIDGDIHQKEKTINLPLMDINYDNFLSKSILLVEDEISDGEVFKLIMNKISKKLGMTISFELRHGGGENITKIFDNLCSERRFGVCIIDSDLRNPHGEISAKQKKIKKKIDTCEWPLMRLEVLPCREVENIFPHSVVTSIDHLKNSPLNSHINKILSYEKKNNVPLIESFWLYYDIKCGLKPDDLDKEVNSWLKDKIQDSGIIIGKFPNIAYGDFINNFLRANKSKSVFSKHMSQNNEWVQVFQDLFERISWNFIKSNPKIT